MWGDSPSSNASCIAGFARRCCFRIFFSQGNAIEEGATMFKRLSVLTVLALMGALFLSLVPTAHAQRGGFGRGGFGRGGIGNGHASGHGGPAPVTVVQASGNFFLHFRSGFDGNGFNNFGTSHIS